MRTILTSFLLFIFSSISAYQYDLSVVAIFHNESRFMKEWIEYNKLIGVEHFWLYNNESDDDYANVLYPYVQSGLVELIDWPTRGEKKDFAFKTQSPAYMDAVTRSIGKTKWLAMIDLDEFMVPKEGDTITKLLNKHFKNEVGVVLYWQMFGTSSYAKLEPNDLMIEKLNMKAPKGHLWHKMYKSIVKPEYVHLIDNPHYAHYKKGEAVNTNKKPTNQSKEKENYTINLMQLNHYWTRDLYNIYTQKWARLHQYGNNDLDKYLEEIEILNSEKDLVISKFIPKLKKQMNAD